MMRQVLIILAITMAGWSSSLAGNVPENGMERDSLILFRFVPGKLMFYSPFAGNEESIQQVVQLIERHRWEIERGQAFIRVMGYCCSFKDKTANLQAAKNRSNQVKSYFITHHGMKEDYYRTGNRSTAFQGMRDVVAVVGLVYAKDYQPEKQEESIKQDTIPATPPVPADTVKTEELTTTPVEPVKRDITPATPSTPIVAAPEPGRLAIKTNLLYDLLLLPTLELEYRFNDRWSLNLEGSVAWWRIDGGVNKYYDLWIISPEARYWFKSKAPWHGHHAGFFAGGGAYDLENGKQGYKGEYFMTGLAYGFMFPVKGCKSLHLEANIGIGYMYTEYEKYLPIDGHYVYQETGRTNYFGPLKAKFSLVWILNWWKKGGKQ